MLLLLETMNFLLPHFPVINELLRYSTVTTYALANPHHALGYLSNIGKLLAIVGRGGALVEAITFNRRVVGSTPALSATEGPWASSLPTCTVACALWRETQIQYPCYSRERL